MLTGIKGYNISDIAVHFVVSIRDFFLFPTCQHLKVFGLQGFHCINKPSLSVPLSLRTPAERHVIRDSLTKMSL